MPLFNKSNKVKEKLIELTKHRVLENRRYALEQFSFFSGTDVVDEVQGQLNHTDSLIRVFAVETLGEAAISTFERALEDLDIVY